MLRNVVILTVLCAAWSLRAADREFDFSKSPVNETPKGFRSTVTGSGKPGDWKVINVEVPPLLQPLTPGAPVVTRQTVLAQLSQDRTDEHFPLLILDDDTYTDFTFTVRAKTVSGDAEQMAGVAFRIQDEKNYYYVRASSKGNTFRFYKLVNGVRSEQIIGKEIKIPTGVWQTLTVECKGNQIHCLLNGEEVIPMMTDNTFASGKIGFWTKSDSVSYFTGASIHYIPREYPAQTAVTDIMKRYPRLLGLKVFATPPNKSALEMIASNDEKEVGTPAEKVEEDVIGKSVIYHGRTQKTVVVTLPVRDRNGETIAALRVVMQPFPGQTEQNAIIRAMPFAKMVEDRIKNAKELTE